MALQFSAMVISQEEISLRACNAGLLPDHGNEKIGICKSLLRSDECVAGYRRAFMSRIDRMYKYMYIAVCLKLKISGRKEQVRMTCSCSPMMLDTRWDTSFISCSVEICLKTGNP